jgi:hypothetical protein
LNLIRGMIIINVQQEIGITIPINERGEHKILTEIPLALCFDRYNLCIYNNWKIIGDF